MANKVLDLEDRSRRKNRRMRGIPETVTPDALNQFLINLMAIVLPQRSTQDLIIDCIHRTPEPRHLPQQIPRDTIARIHFYHIKEEFLKALRSQLELPARFKNISIYPDLSAITILKMQGICPIYKDL